MVKQLKQPYAAANPSATTDVVATSRKHAAKSAESPAHCSPALGSSRGVGIRKKCYVIFEGTASQSLRAAFAKRLDWRDGTTAHDDAASDEARESAPPPRQPATTGWQRAAQNVRCHEALQRASGRGGVSFCWRHMPPKHPDTSSVVVNRWHGSETLTEKDRMLRALLSYYEARGVDPFGQADAALLPLSFELPSLFREARPLASLPAWAPFAAAHAAAAAAREPRVPTSWCARNLWLLKPARGSGGEGIWIGSSLCEAEALLRASSQRSVTAWVAQKYIEAPLLFEQRKFDVRMWAAIASDASPLGLACWAYREGYLRTSSAPYSTEAATSDAEAQRVHLTNHCLQRQHESLGEHEEGNTASLAALQRDAPHLRLREEVLPQMFATMADATLAARGALLSGLAAAGRGGRGAAQGGARRGGALRLRLHDHCGGAARAHRDQRQPYALSQQRLARAAAPAARARLPTPRARREVAARRAAAAAAAARWRRGRAVRRGLALLAACRRRHGRGRPPSLPHADHRVGRVRTGTAVCLTGRGGRRCGGWANRPRGGQCRDRAWVRVRDWWCRGGGGGCRSGGGRTVNAGHATRPRGAWLAASAAGLN